MNSQIYVSTGAFCSRDLACVLKTAVEAKLNIELSSSVDPNPKLAELSRAAKKDLRLLVHNYFPPPADAFVLNLASTQPALLAHSIAFCKRAIDLCVEVGSPFYGVHAGFGLDLEPAQLGDPLAQKTAADQTQVSREKAYETFVKAVREVADYARKHRIGLLIENNVAVKEARARDKQSRVLLADIEEIQRFLVDTRGTDVRLLLDVGHAKVSAHSSGQKPESYFEKLANYIGALHLSENDGLRDSNQVFDKRAWFAPFLRSFPDCPMIIETYQLPLNGILSQCDELDKMLS